MILLAWPVQSTNTHQPGLIGARIDMCACQELVG
jgi:hypothetical protein